MMIAAFAALLLGFASCNKDENTADQSNLMASKTAEIKLGEPVNFTLTPAPDAGQVNWSVMPGENVQINAVANKASILFRSAGTFSVRATYGDLGDSVIVIVEDSLYNPGGGEPVYEPLSGDQIFITVSRLDSMGISGLDFNYVTDQLYSCLNHTLLYSNDFYGDGLKVVFNSVFIPAEEYCTAGEDHAYGGTAWYPIEEGSHVFEVFLDGTTYTGSFVKSGSTYTFTWPYESGVTLTPLIIN